MLKTSRFKAPCRIQIPICFRCLERSQESDSQRSQNEGRVEGDQGENSGSDRLYTVKVSKNNKIIHCSFYLWLFSIYSHAEGDCLTLMFVFYSKRNICNHFCLFDNYCSYHSSSKTMVFLMSLNKRMKNLRVFLYAISCGRSC